MTVTPDPRPPRRTIDRAATRRACLMWPWCWCGNSAASGHHVIKRSQGGDDVIANIVPACGSGTTGCHGLLEAEDEQTRRALGEYLLGERPDTIAYVLGKLGDVAGADWLRRRLFVEVTP
jgi:hypothetical protein